ncbi:hypothetical protein lerEdw1_005775 [Lerista edwardsae]|nr:hypothetical protein lerEdw1_005775 [Lerista edwardsae]
MSKSESRSQAEQNESANMSYTEFFLLAFPGLQKSRYLLTIPFFCIYLMILPANSTLIYLVKEENNLHAPMYLLIALLLAVNVFGTTTVLPQMLLSFIFGSSSISLAGCLVQMFLLYLAIMLDTGILLMMALDRYVAICHPLRYADILTNKNLAFLMLGTLVRSLCIVCPVVILASQVRFCRSNIVEYFACEHMALMELSCGDSSRNGIVGTAVRSFTITFDPAFLAISCSRIILAALKMASGSARHKHPPPRPLHWLLLLSLFRHCLSRGQVSHTGCAQSAQCTVPAAPLGHHPRHLWCEN